MSNKQGKFNSPPLGEKSNPIKQRAGGNYRWMICALLFFATTINYIDRQVIGLLKTTLSSEMGWNEIDYSNIVLAFQFAYAIGLLVVGRMMDWLGTKKGFSLSIIFCISATSFLATGIAFSQRLSRSSNTFAGTLAIRGSRTKSECVLYPSNFALSARSFTISASTLLLSNSLPLFPRFVYASKIFFRSSCI